MATLAIVVTPVGSFLPGENMPIDHLTEDQVARLVDLGAISLPEPEAAAPADKNALTTAKAKIKAHEAEIAKLKSEIVDLNQAHDLKVKELIEQASAAEAEAADLKAKLDEAVPVVDEDNPPKDTPKFTRLAPAPVE